MAIYGGGIFSCSSIVVFKNKSNVTFHSNSATTHGGATLINNSEIYTGESMVINLVNNFAKSFGGALCSNNKSATIFGGNTIITFQSNEVVESGGALYFEYSSLSLDENSKVTFCDNMAKNGGAFFSLNFKVLFGQDTNVTFSNNEAEYGGAASITSYSAIIFDGNTTVTYKSNKASTRGGAIYSYKKCNITFDIHSTVLFYKNSALYGGAVLILGDSIVSYNKNTTVKYVGNKASGSGGGIYSCESCSVTFDGNSAVTFNDKYGGAIYLRIYSKILFSGRTTEIYNNSKANTSGGAIYSHNKCNITFDRHSSVTFHDSSAIYGGAVLSTYYCTILFDGNTTVTCKHNNASENGGVIDFHEYSSLTFHGNSKVEMSENEVRSGGAVYSTLYSEISFDGYTRVIYNSNKASSNGGAISSNKKCHITIDKQSKVTFCDNITTNGGVVYSIL